MESFNKWIIKHRIIIVSTLLLTILFGLFAAILEDVYERDPKILNADINIAQYITSVREPILNTFFLNITKLGDVTYMAIAIVLAFGFFYLSKKYNQLVTLFLTLSGSVLMTVLIKNVVQRARPIDGLIAEHGFSFPSAHAFMAVCFWGVLFYLLSTVVKSKLLKFTLIILGIVLALLIGFSRVYIGVHWPSDVVASFLLSTVYCVVIIFLVNNHSKVKSFVYRIFNIVN